ncbi:MAG: SDR family NAD(P)-dependent oxidoreductase [Myxococcota bacterium]
MRNAIIAGVGPGVGIAVAERFGREGFTVALLARNEQRLDHLGAELGRKGVQAITIPVDLSEPSAVRSAMQSAEGRLGSVDLLVYNAAVWREVPVMDIDPETFIADLSLSVVGALVSAQTVYPGMRERGSGTIIFTGGGLALFPEYGKGVSSLSASKAALRNLAFAMAKESEADGVHVATVTIAGAVEVGTPFDPAFIAEEFWTLHHQARPDWQVERVFKGLSPS